MCYSVLVVSVSFLINNLQSTVGSVKYAPDQSAVIWTIKTFPVSLVCTQLPQVACVDEVPKLMPEILLSHSYDTNHVSLCFMHMLYCFTGEKG